MIFSIILVIIFMIVYFELGWIFKSILISKKLLHEFQQLKTLLDSPNCNNIDNIKIKFEIIDKLNKYNDSTSILYNNIIKTFKYIFK